MISINLTVHNKGFLIESVLEAIKKYTVSDYELIIVMSGCTDDSEKKIVDFSIENPKINCVRFAMPNIFETKANNLAAKNSIGDYIIIMQDDMVINEMGWDQRLLKPFVFDDVFAVTARTAHNWKANLQSEHLYANPPPGIWSDILIHTDHANKENTPRDMFAIRECVNRGPLALRHSDFEKLNYFDPIFAPFDMDDHDLCYRASRLGKICGCYWIDFISLNEWGGSRENGKPKQWALDAQHKNSKIVLERHRDLIEGAKRIEQRMLI